MGFTTWTSTMKMTAAMMTAASEDLGMKAKYGVKKKRDSSTKSPGDKKRKIRFRN